MKKRTETLQADKEFVKTYDDSKFEKPSVTADIVIFEMFDSEETNYRKIAEKKLKVLLIQRGAAPFERCYALPGGFVRPGEMIGEAAERELREETNLNCDFLEQFGTYSDPERDPRRWVMRNIIINTVLIQYGMAFLKNHAMRLYRKKFLKQRIN